MQHHFAAIVPIFVVKHGIEVQFVQNSELLIRDLRQILIGIAVEVDLAGSRQPQPLNELFDRYACGGLDAAGDGQCCEHDREMGLYGVALAMEDRKGLEIGPRHPEWLLHLEELDVGVDHLLRGYAKVVHLAFYTCFDAVLLDELGVHLLLAALDGEKAISLVGVVSDAMRSAFTSARSMFRRSSDARRARYW